MVDFFPIVGTTDEDVCVCINMEKLHMRSLNFISDNNLVLYLFFIAILSFWSICICIFNDSYANIDLKTIDLKIERL